MEQETKVTQSYIVHGCSRPDKETCDGINQSSRKWHAQRLSALAALAESLIPFPVPTCLLATTCNSSSRQSCGLTSLLLPLHAYDAHTSMEAKHSNI